MTIPKTLQVSCVQMHWAKSLEFNLERTLHYIKVAAGRDYADIRPVSGTYRGGKTRSLIVDVRVRQDLAAGATL